MIGNQYYINNKIARDPQVPVNNLRIIEVIMDMYWDEFKKKLSEAEVPVVQVTHLGTWYADNSILRGYIRKLIRDIRNIRKIEAYKNGGEGLIAKHDYKVKRLKSALKQLNNLRYVILERKNKYRRKRELQDKL